MIPSPLQERLNWHSLPASEGMAGCRSILRGQFYLPDDYEVGRHEIKDPKDFLMSLVGMVGKNQSLPQVGEIKARDLATEPRRSSNQGCLSTTLKLPAQHSAGGKSTVFRGGDKHRPWWREIPFLVFWSSRHGPKPNIYSPASGRVLRLAFKFISRGLRQA